MPFYCIDEAFSVKNYEFIALVVGKGYRHGRKNSQRALLFELFYLVVAKAQTLEFLIDSQLLTSE